MKPSEGEVVRIRHLIENLRGLLSGLDMSLELGVPVTESAVAVADAAIRIATSSARHDAYLRIESSPSDDLQQYMAVPASALRQHMTQEHRATFALMHTTGLGALQTRVLAGDEDARLAEMTAAFEAYFATCRTTLGHDEVPVLSWETYQIIKRRHAQVHP